MSHVLYRSVSPSQFRSMSNLTVYDALKQMRRRSANDQPSSFSFMSYNRKQQSTHGIVEVRRGILKRRTKEATFDNTEIIEEYIDLDTLEHRRFYQPTLLTFNGQKLSLV